MHFGKAVGFVFSISSRLSSTSSSALTLLQQQKQHQLYLSKKGSIITRMSSTAIEEETTPKLRAIVFDMDGTLTKPHAIDFARMRKRCNIPPHDINNPASGSILELVSKLSKDEQQKCHEIIVEEEHLGLENMELNHGFSHLMEIIHQNNILVGISTRNMDFAIDRFMEIIKTKSDFPHHHSLFDPLLHRDCKCPVIGEVLKNKPHPDPALSCLRKWGIDHTNVGVSDKVLFIGDHEDDLVCGRSANCNTIFITNKDDLKEDSYASRFLTSERKHYADHVCQDLFDVAKIVSKML